MRNKLLININILVESLQLAYTKNDYIFKFSPQVFLLFSSTHRKRHTNTDNAPWFSHLLNTIPFEDWSPMFKKGIKSIWSSWRAPLYGNSVLLQKPNRSLHIYKKQSQYFMPQCFHLTYSLQCKQTNLFLCHCDLRDPLGKKRISCSLLGK